MFDYLRFLNRLTSQRRGKYAMKSGTSAGYEIRAISQLCPSVFSSSAYSFYPMKAYTNPHKAILAIDDITLGRS
jgi:hypothetical protein